MDLVLLAVLAVAGAALQRAFGVGYSLLLLPGALLVLPADRVVPCVLGAGVVLGSMLLARGGRPATLGRAAPVLVAAPVGQVLAVVWLGALSGPSLRWFAAVLLLLGVALSTRPLPTPPVAAAVTAGVLLGAVAALTGVIGPFLAVMLVALRDAGAVETRRRLWLGVALLSATGLAAVLATGAGDPVGALYGLLLAPALAVGVRLGDPLAARVPDRLQLRAVLSVSALGIVILAAGAA